MTQKCYASGEAFLIRSILLKEENIRGYTDHSRHPGFVTVAD